MPRASRLVALCYLLSAAGCAAPLANPEAFEDRAPLSAGGGDTSAGGSSAGTDAVAGGLQAGASTAGASAAGAGTGGGASGGDTSSGGTAAASVGGATQDGDLPACVAALFKSTNSGKCSNGICHHGANAPGGLDLSSPGVTTRLLDQPALHIGANPNTGCPKGDKLIDSTSPDSSWLLKKLKLTAADCGAQMPATGSLSSDELSCLTTWVEGF